MIKRKYLYLAILLCMILCIDTLSAKLDLNLDLDRAEIEKKLQEAHTQTGPVPSEEKIKSKKNKKKRKKEPLIKFDFKDEKLTTIINRVAAKKGWNIILPQGADTIKTTITFDQKKKISLSLAEKYMYQFLDLAGYKMHPQASFFVITKKTDQNATRVPLHLYINVDPKKLPQSDEPIRAIYYLANFKVPATTQGNEPLNLILKDMLDAKRGYLFDPKSNAIILTGSANNIASVMTIILELDNAGSSEVVEVFPLYNATATTVAKLLNEQIIATLSAAKGAIRGPVKKTSGLYFTPNTRVVADPRTNSIIVIGTESAVLRIKEFVREYMDQPVESGRSILHVYNLQYLNAKEFAPVLNNVVKQSKTGQAEQEFGGAQRFFEEVIIIAEEEQAVTSRTIGGVGAQAQGKVTVGGNRLIVAAKTEDWEKIRQLIDELDKPELQVIIEIMILDITVEGIRRLQAQTRNPKILDLHENIEFQTAHINTPILDANNTTLAADLLRLVAPPEAPTSSLARLTTLGSGAGSMIISLNDSCKTGIWSVLKVLDKWVESKVVSHPFIVTKNNIKARESITQIRRGAGSIRKDTSSVTTINQEDFKAILAVEVTPRISSLERLNLQIKIEIEDFIEGTEFSRTARSVETNANMSSGQILVLGGLAKTNDTEIETKWPILGDIPIIGALFRGTSKTKIKNNLVVFIHPSIVDPKLRTGQQKYTEEKIDKEYLDLAESELSSKSKDPIVRFFFAEDTIEEGEDILSEYLEGTEYKTATTPLRYRPDLNNAQKNNQTQQLKTMLSKEKNPLITEKDPLTPAEVKAEVV